MSDTNHANAYLRTKVMSASPEELRLMLIEGAIKFARQGRQGLADKDFEASYNGITQCRNIVVELMSTLRDDVAPELCDRVRSLYGFIFRELTEASHAKDPARLDTTIELLEYERETWVMLMDKLAADRSGGTGPIPMPQPGTAPASLPGTIQERGEGGSLSIQA